MAASWSPLRVAAGGEAAQVMLGVRPGTRACWRFRSGENRHDL